jgi:hypothetical protein
MGALIYLSPEARDRRDAIVAFLDAAPWCGPVFAGPELAEVGLPTDSALAVAFSMPKQDLPNRFGVQGLGAVAADPFTKNDARGLGQHGGLGAFETRPFLLASGPDVSSGAWEGATRAVDIAPTILSWLGQSWDGTDGTPLPLT